MGLVIVLVSESAPERSMPIAPEVAAKQGYKTNYARQDLGTDPDMVGKTKIEVALGIPRLLAEILDVYQAFRFVDFPQRHRVTCFHALYDGDDLEHAGL